MSLQHSITVRLSDNRQNPDPPPPALGVDIGVTVCHPTLETLPQDPVPAVAAVRGPGDADLGSKER